MKQHASQAIVELMQEVEHDLPWLLRAVQAAIELELSTIPPYLCALWSIIDDTDLAFTHVRSIVREEMAHMGLMCNLLKALGQTPRIISVAPHYPGPLPGGVRPKVTVYLSGLTKRFLCEVAMQIEKPEHPLALLAAEEIFTSIGKFYDAISAALSNLHPPLKVDGQLVAPQIRLNVLASEADALEAIERIKLQGEGTAVLRGTAGALLQVRRDLPREAARRDEARQVRVRRRPRALPEPVSHGARAGGWPTPLPDAVKTALAQFDSAYRTMLQLLEDAWTSGSQDTLADAIGVMVGRLRGPAQTLMQIPFENGENYGPDFIIII
jgi:Ferritin-like